MTLFKIVATGLFSSLLLSAGCAEPLPEFGQVEGVVTVKGKPQKGLIITFMPDPAAGNDWPFNASGKTDDQGKYILLYAHKGMEGPGAPTGWNRATIQDTRYASIPQGAPLPPRLFSTDYSGAATTPLKYEVKPGPQTINIEL